MSYFTRAISSAIISYGIAQESERELYEYSILILLEQSSIWGSVICIACLFGILWETVFYMVLFIPLRIYAGGYHARTFTCCYFISIATFLTFAVVQHYVVVSGGLMLFVALLSAIIILTFSPMADPNKPMSIQEKVSYTKWIRALLGVEITIAACIFISNTEVLFFAICFAFFHLALLLIIGKTAILLTVNNHDR